MLSDVLSAFPRPPWRMANMVKEVMNLTRHLHAPFRHIKRSSNPNMDLLAKEFGGKV